jgi:hypothetical protein
MFLHSKNLTLHEGEISLFRGGGVVPCDDHWCMIAKKRWIDSQGRPWHLAFQGSGIRPKIGALCTNSRDDFFSTVYQ